MITDFRKWVTYLGNSDLATYTFPFKVKSVKDIVVVQIDISLEPPVVDWVERGDTQINIQSVTFDPIMGGGTITFHEVLPAGKRIYIKLADDQPTQLSRFREQQDFKLVHFEWALDFIVNQTTRLSDKTQRSLKFADHFTHVESVVNLEMQEFPMAFGMPIMSDDALQLEMKPILQILEEAGVIQLIQNAQDAADLANSRLDVLEPIVQDHEERIDQLEIDFPQVAADAAAAAQSAQDAAESAAEAAQSAQDAEQSAANVQDIYADLAALLASLPPGAITTILGGGGGTSGVMRQDFIDQSLNIHPDAPALIEYDGLKEYAETETIIPFMNGLLFGNVDGLAAMTVARKDFTKQNVLVNPDHQPEADVQPLIVAYCYSTCGLKFAVDFFGYGDGVTNNWVLSQTAKNVAMVKGYRNGVKALQGNVTAAGNELTFLDGPATEDQLVFAVYQIDTPSMFDNRVEFLAGTRDGVNRTFGPVLFRPADKLSAILTYNGIALSPGKFRIIDNMIEVAEGFEPEDTQIPELDYCYAL